MTAATVMCNDVDDNNDNNNNNHHRHRKVGSHSHSLGVASRMMQSVNTT